MNPAPDFRAEAVQRLLEAGRGDLLDRAVGCLLGGAVGDALGAPVEFASRLEVQRQFGDGGLRDYAPAFGKLGAITDDTQMTLFTAEGLMRAFVRTALRGIGPVFAPVTDRAYARWLHTQGERAGFEGEASRPDSGWLIGHSELFARRAPGLTCLSALRDKRQAGEPANNDSKGCGGVMRVAPVGLLAAALWGEQAEARDLETFQLGCDIAGLTHGHPSGRLPAGYLAVLIAALSTGRPWGLAHARARAQLAQSANANETLAALDRAVQLAQQDPRSPSCVSSLGQGWVAEEALAIGVYCACGALRQGDDRQAFEDALGLAVNHDGDSDSTAAITGHIVGAALGKQCIGANWVARLELAEVIEQVAEDLVTVRLWRLDDQQWHDETQFWWQRYPGG